MNWIKDNWFKLFIALLSLIVTISIVLYFVVLPILKQNDAKNKSASNSKSENNLSERFRQYYDKLEVGLCTEAYDMHSKGSKERLPYKNFEIHCEITQKWERDFKIDKIVYSGDTRADLRFTYNEMGIDENNAEFKKCIASPYSNWQSCSSNATKKLDGKKEDIGTWLFEDGQWHRDF